MNELLNRCLKELRLNQPFPQLINFVQSMPQLCSQEEMNRLLTDLRKNAIAQNKIQLAKDLKKHIK